MGEQFSMADLRRTAAKIYAEELGRIEQSSIANKTVIERIKSECPEQVSAVSSQLIDRQINKILNDARVRAANFANGEGPNLFDEFPHVGPSISICRGETKALQNATVLEVEKELRRRNERSQKKLEDDEFNKLWKTLKPFVASEADTVAELWERKLKSDKK